MKEQYDILIAKYLAGEADKEEVKQLVDWIAESEENRTYYSKMKVLYNHAQPSAEWQPDVDVAWNKVKGTLQTTGQKEVRLFEFRTVLKMAAAIFFVCVTTIVVYTLSQINSGEIAEGTAISGGNVKSVLLPDSSYVFLNKNSSARYVYDEDKGLRYISLKGEAYFSVKHDSTQQFIVEANGLYIHDIGTEFNVQSFENSNEVRVLVSEGQVLLTDSVRSLSLVAGESAVYHKQLRTLSKMQPDSNSIAYRTGVFTFNNTTLDVVAATLNAVYSKQIIIADSATNKCRLTATFRNEELDNIADIISATFELQIRFDDRNVVLSGGKCN